MPADPACRWRVMFLGQGPLAEVAYSQLLDLGESAGLRVEVACSNTESEGAWWRTARIREWALAKSTPFVSNSRRNDQLLTRSAAERSVNCLISVGHPWILSDELLRSIEGGVAFNLHNAPLPRFGGFNTSSHAILEGVRDFGATLHWMEPVPDAGPIAFQEPFELASDATAKRVHTLTLEAGHRLFGRLVDHLVEGRLPPRVPMTGPPRIYPRGALAGHREIVDIADEVELDRKSRAFWFPPFEPAFYLSGGRKYHLVPASGLAEVGIRA